MEPGISYIPDLIEDLRVKCQEELDESHDEKVVKLLENSIQALKLLEDAFVEVDPSKADLHLNSPIEISPKSIEPWD